MESPAFELLAEEGERGLHLLVPSVPERFQCQRGAARRAVARVEVVFLGVVAGAMETKNTLSPAPPPPNSTSPFLFFLGGTTTPTLLFIMKTSTHTPFFVQSS